MAAEVNNSDKQYVLDQGLKEDNIKIGGGGFYEDMKG